MSDVIEVCAVLKHTTVLIEVLQLLPFEFVHLSIYLPIMSNPC